MEKVLYRKYRPQNLDEVIGQSQVIDILAESIKSNTLNHAYIFSGPRGTGKTSTAKLLGSILNCQNPTDDLKVCGECASCQKLSDHPDVYEIDAASNNGVEEIREIRENVKYLPILGTKKVYII